MAWKRKHMMATIATTKYTHTKTKKNTKTTTTSINIAGDHWYGFYCDIDKIVNKSTSSVLNFTILRKSVGAEMWKRDDGEGGISNTTFKAIAIYRIWPLPPSWRKLPHAPSTDLLCFIFHYEMYCQEYYKCTKYKQTNKHSSKQTKKSQVI